MGMDVGRLDLRRAPGVAKPRREPVARSPLGVGPGQPALERAQLADHLQAGGGVHGRGIIPAGVASALRSDEPIHERDRVPAGNRVSLRDIHLEPAVSAPPDPELVAGLTEDPMMSADLFEKKYRG